MIGIGIGPGFGQRGPAFLPTNINGVQLWLRADKGYAAGTWADQSGTGDANKNATQATAGDRKSVV